jgi:hypothetical protein
LALFAVADDRDQQIYYFADYQPKQQAYCRNANRKIMLPLPLYHTPHTTRVTARQPGDITNTEKAITKATDTNIYIISGAINARPAPVASGPAAAPTSRHVWLRANALTLLSG